MEHVAKKQDVKKEIATMAEVSGKTSGDLVYFFTGSYEGKFGWSDTNAQTSGSHFPVLIDLGDRKIKRATVSMWSIAKPFPDKPRSFAKAVMRQRPKIEKAIKQLATQL
eukprot:7087009-Ditylum_brightwellii.AAC.1